MRSMISVAIVAAFLLPTLPVMADPPPWAPAHGRRAKDADREEERDREDANQAMTKPPHGRPPRGTIPTLLRFSLCLR